MNLFNYLTDVYLVFLTPIVLWVLFYLIYRLVRRFSQIVKEIEFKFFIYLTVINIAFSFTGLSIGILTGWSSSPVVGVVIPALLTFFGGMVSYAFVFKKNSSNKSDGLIMAFSLISISFFLIIGTDYGTQIRVREERNKSIIEKQDRIEYETFLHNLKNTQAQPEERKKPIIKTEIER